MLGANMSVVWHVVVKCFATGVTGEGALDGSLVMGFQVTIESQLVSKPFVAAGAFVGE